MRYAPLLLCLLLLACGSSATTGAASKTQDGQFPTVEELERIGQAPAPDQLFDPDVVDVASWELAGPLPQAIGTARHTYEDPFGDLLEAAAADRPDSYVVSSAAACAAREIGRFWLTQGGQPARPLQRFIASRCGFPGVNLAASFLSSEIPDSATEEDIVAKWKPQAEQVLADLGKRGRQHIGLWFGREGNKAVLSFVQAAVDVRLEPVQVARGAEEATVKVRGELLIPAQRVSGMINQGRYGAARCENTPGIKLPSFEMTCPMLGSDPHTWLDIAAFPAGRILGTSVAAMLLFPSGEPSTRWAAPTDVPSMEILDPASMAVGVVGALNKVREAAGLKPLTLSTEQTELNLRVAPHYFGAVFGKGDPTLADRVVLGLQAGWRVEGDVKKGAFASGWTVHNHDVGKLLAELLERPSSRSVLLDEGATHVAIGPLMSGQPKALATIVTTYSLFDAETLATADEHLMESLTRARGMAGATNPISGIDDLLDQAALDVRRGFATPNEALEKLLSKVTNRLKRGTRGMVVTTTDIDDFEWNKNLLQAGPLDVAIRVTQRRARGEAWARYVVLVVIAAPATGPGGDVVNAGLDREGRLARGM